MTREELLMMISRLCTVIGFLEGKWYRPQSEAEAAIIQTLLDMRETVRKAYVAMGNEVVHE